MKRLVRHGDFTDVWSKLSVLIFVHNIIFEHLKADVTLFAKRKQTTATNVEFFEDARKQLDRNLA